jgi:hypothetical protein
MQRRLRAILTELRCRFQRLYGLAASRAYYAMFYLAEASPVSEADAEEQIARAEKFLKLAEGMLGAAD